MHGCFLGRAGWPPGCLQMACESGERRLALDLHYGQGVGQDGVPMHNLGLAQHPDFLISLLRDGTKKKENAEV